MECKTCQFWSLDRDKVSWEAELLKLGHCSKAVELWNGYEWSKEGNEDNTVVAIKDHAQMMYVEDGSMYRADLYTKAEFFCAHYAKKD